MGGKAGGLRAVLGLRFALCCILTLIRAVHIDIECLKFPNCSACRSFSIRISVESRSSWKAVIHLLHGAFACALCSLLTDFKRICLGNCCCRVSASKTSEGQFVTSNSLVQPYIPKRFETRLLPSDAPKFNNSPLFSTAACEFGHLRSNDPAISCQKAAFLVFVSIVCKKSLQCARLFPVCAQNLSSLSFD